RLWRRRRPSARRRWSTAAKPVAAGARESYTIAARRVDTSWLIHHSGRVSMKVEQPALRIADRLRLERESRSWTLGDVANRSGVSRAMISKIERGEASPTA